MVIYCHVGYPLALDQAHGQKAIFFQSTARSHMLDFEPTNRLTKTAHILDQRTCTDESNFFELQTF